MLKEDDILGVAKLILPAANLAISSTRKLFSGEPSMTLKVTTNQNLIDHSLTKNKNLYIAELNFRHTGSSILSSRSRVWASYNTVETLYAWYEHCC